MHTWWLTTSPGTVVSTLPPASAARSTVTEPGRMLSTMSRVTSTGARLPGTSAVVMMMSTCQRVGSRMRSALVKTEGSMLSAILRFIGINALLPGIRGDYGVHQSSLLRLATNRCMLPAHVRLC